MLIQWFVSSSTLSQSFVRSKMSRLVPGGIRSRFKRVYRACNHHIFAGCHWLVPTVGINLGGGQWRKLGWRNLDSRHMTDIEGAHLTPSSRLPEVDQSLSYVYSNHFFEHIDDATAQQLMNESHRILKTGGVFRVSVPDFELGMKAYRDRNHAFFDKEPWGLEVRYENWEMNSVSVSLENKLTSLFVTYENVSDQGLWPPWKHIPGYYSGPVIAERAEIQKNAETMNIHEFSDWLLTRLPPTFNCLGHINVYDLEKFKRMLDQAGFSKVVQSRFRESAAPVLRGPDFDNRPEISLFVEAIK